MAERYTNLFRLACPRGCAGAPVLIAAGSLLQDSYSGNLLCQLKLLSLSDLAIKAVTVEIRMLDSGGARFSSAVPHTYLDLQVRRGEEFGGQTAIILPRRDARSFTAAVTEVIFEDGDRWQADADAQWQTLPAPASLEEAYGDAQLAEQFRIRYGSDCRNLPTETELLWFCTCGAVNRPEENACFRCRRVRSALVHVNVDSLRQEASERLKQEEVRQAEDRIEVKKQRRKLLKIAGVILPILILAMGLLKTVPAYLQQKQDYQNAAALLAAGRYEQAAEAFAALDGYRDSAEQAEKNVPYQRALYILDRARADDAAALNMVGHSRADLTEERPAAIFLYEGAMAEFKTLGKYKDSAEMVRRCEAGIEEVRLAMTQDAYAQAASLLESGHYSEARQAFLELEDFQDSPDMAEEAAYRKAHALYRFILEHDVRQIRADLSISPERGSTFSLPKSVAFAHDSQCVTDLRAACGEDLIDIDLSDTPSAKLRPLADCVTQLFRQLGDYKDSAACIAGILDATDYTKDFYVFCEAGDLYGAADWLRSYDGEFADRERWHSLLELYQPFCAAWKLYGGDVTVIPMTVGRSQPCESFSTKVILKDDRAVLRLSANDGEEYFLDLYAELGEVRFSNFVDDNCSYFLVINNTGRLSYMQYDGSGKLRTSCEYSPA